MWPLMVPLSIAFLTGTALGRTPISWWSWFILLLFLGVVTILRARGIPFWICLVAMILIGAGWSGMQCQTLHRQDLLIISGHATDPILAKCEGTVLSMSGTRMQLHVTKWMTSEKIIQTSGRITVRTPDHLKPELTGKAIQVIGWINPVPASFRDQTDWLTIAIDGGYRGWMKLESWQLLKVVQGQEASTVSLKRKIQSWATCVLMAEPLPAHGPVKSLLSALLLGQRDDLWNKVAAPFQRLGVSHLLAISGMHLGMLVGMAVFMVRAGRDRRSWHGFFILGVIVAYMCIVELRPPIIRAGIMTATACIGLLFQRRFSGIGLLSMSLVLVLAYQPGQLTRPGFQLSFIVVAGLILLVYPVRKRWFGSSSTTESKPLGVLKEWFINTFTASTIAWVVSIPIVIGHFGQFSIASVPMTIALTPLVALILALGSLRICLGEIPLITDVLAVLMSNLAHCCLHITKFVDEWPLMSIEGIKANWTWVCSAMIWIVSWCLAERLRYLLWPSFTLILAWLLLMQVASGDG